MRVLLLSIFIVQALTMERNKIYMRKAEMQDQAASDTTYIYSTNSAGPVSYNQYKDSTGNLANLGYPLLTLQHGHGSERSPYPLKYYEPNSYAGPFRKTEKDAQSGILHDLNYEKGKGQSYEAEYRSRKGEKEQSGYNNIQEFDKGSRGKHETVEQEGYYGEKGGNKKNYLDESKHYDSKQDSVDGYEGGSSSKSSDSKSGAKTTGYHKQFNKDEYKKKHTFYDESDRKGHFNKYGDVNSKHFVKNGGHKQGGQGNSGYYEDYYGEKGQYDKGHYLDNDNKYKGQKGDSKYYTDYSDYAKQRDQDSGKSYGYNEKY